MFCRLKCLPATTDKLALRRHVWLASKAYLHISSWHMYGAYSSDYHRSLVLEYSAAIKQCLVDVARRDETSCPRNDPNMSPPLQHRPPPFVFDPPKVSEVRLSLVAADEEETPVLLGGGTTLGLKARGELQNNILRGTSTLQLLFLSWWLLWYRLRASEIAPLCLPHLQT